MTSTNGATDKQTDVLVVGFGGAGACAAIEATDAGAEVLIIEKMKKPGGATYQSGGIIYAAGTSVQRAAGVEDSADAMYAYWMAVDNGQKEAALARTIADQSGPLIEWLISLGAEVPPEDLYSSGAESEFAHVTPPRPRAHHIKLKDDEKVIAGPKIYWHSGGGFRPGRGGSHLFTVLGRAVQSRGCEVLMETEALELLTNERKEVVGARVSQHGKSFNIFARKGVVLASGGFTRNLDMHRRFTYKAPWIESGQVIPRGHTGETGDGIKMAMALGADLRDMPWFHAHPSTYVPVANYGEAKEGLVIAGDPRPSIFVNKAGVRFVNEDRYYVIISFAIDRENSVAFQIFDNEIKSQVDIPELKQRQLVSAATIRELATKLDIPPDGLEKTIDDWNQHAVSGSDPAFGKRGLTVAPIATPPFWGGPIRREFHVTYGGLRTNVDAQVLDVLHGKPIRRLYAAGEMTGGKIGYFYPGSGTAIVDALVFGRIAGKKVALEQPLQLAVGDLVGAAKG